MAQHTPAPERRRLVETWQRSTTSKTAFARAHGVKPATFATWVRREERPAWTPPPQVGAMAVPAFLPVQRAARAADAVAGAPGHRRHRRRRRPRAPLRRRAAGRLVRGRRARARVTLTPGPTQQIYLSTELVDMRGGFDRLAARVIQAGFDLYAGHLFVFLSRRRTHLKVLTWDGSGIVILYKRLSKGRFPAVEAATNGACSIPLQAADLAVLLDGLAVSRLRRSPIQAADRGCRPDRRRRWHVIECWP